MQLPILRHSPQSQNPIFCLKRSNAIKKLPNWEFFDGENFYFFTATNENVRSTCFSTLATIGTDGIVIEKSG